MKQSLCQSINKILIKLSLKNPPLPINRSVIVADLDQQSKDNFLDESDRYQYPNNYIQSSRYTIINFFPKNLFEQFQRIANFYFLCIALIQIFIDSSVPLVLNVFPLVFVIVTTMVKQGYEDILRHIADAEVNNVKIQVIKNGKLESVKACELKVGDIVKCITNDTFPCDLLLLSSSEQTGACYVTTASLDGETNLKVVIPTPSTKEFKTCSLISANMRERIRYEHPTGDLYKFEGQIMPIDDSLDIKPLSATNLLLRGARLRNTEFIFGCAVYTGQDTKMSKNSCEKMAKFSQVELRLNYFLAIFLLVLLSLGIVCVSLKYYYLNSVFVNSFYVPSEDKVPWKVVQTFFSFIVLFNYLIPISLYVTIELQKFFGSMFFGWDLNMYDAKQDLPAKANTSDLNEELGQIEFLFSDKTGTLTENEMRFRYCSISGEKFKENNGNLTADSDESMVDFTDLPENIDEFFTVLSLCHTARADLINGTEYEYQASSPDEKAFLEACKQFGVIYLGVNENYESEVMFLKTKEVRRYKIKDILEFDSTRKRMSVIIEYEDGSICVFCKGAETAMTSQVSSNSELIKVSVDTIMNHVTDYALEGLRTLVFGIRCLTKEQFECLHTQLIAANASMVDREKKLSEAYKAIENDLILIGCTGVEDKLQENVKETIEDLRSAGIQVWVLTGDKEETAVNISHSTGHFSNSKDFQEIRITKYNNESECAQAFDNQLERVALAKENYSETQFGLVIDGQTLSFALSPVIVSKLRSLCLECSAVLCCRMTPLQKSAVVSIIKTSKDPPPVTAAVGDGANDVSMILEAHIGIGIYGKEGRQAVRSADYALARFKYLRNAFLMHGHYYYIRIATLVQYFFYKNAAFIGPQFYFTFFSGFSAQTVYESLYLILYNITLTSLPIFIYGIIEKHQQEAYLLNNPKQYKVIRGNKRLHWRSFLKWNAFGIWHSFVALFGPLIIVYQNDVIATNGSPLGLMAFGTIVLWIVWITTSFKLALVTYFWSWATVFGYAFTFVANSIFFLVYQSILFSSTWDIYWVWFDTLQLPSAWLCIFVFVLISLIPDIIDRLIQDSEMWRRNHVQVVHNPPKATSKQPKDNSSNQYDNRGFQRDNPRNGVKSNEMKSNEWHFSNPSKYPTKLVYRP